MGVRGFIQLSGKDRTRVAGKRRRDKVNQAG
jgi:hypothetical protein